MTDLSDWPCSFTSRALQLPDAARWVAVGIRAGLLGFDTRPAWHRSRWDWSRTSASLGLAQRYAKLTPQQRAIHNAYAASDDCPPALRELMPAETRMAISAAQWHLNEPVAVEPWLEPDLVQTSEET